MNVKAGLAELAVGERFAVSRGMHKFTRFALGAIREKLAPFEHLANGANCRNCHGAEYCKRIKLLKLKYSKVIAVAVGYRAKTITYEAVYFHISLDSFAPCLRPLSSICPHPHLWWQFSLRRPSPSYLVTQ